MRTISAGLLALALVPAWGAASAPPLAAQSLTVRPHLAAGLDLQLRDGSASNLGALGLAGLELRRPGSRLSARLDLTYFHRQRDTRDAPDDVSHLTCGPTCNRDYRFQLLGLALDGKFDLSRGSVRPYVASGLGVYHEVTTQSTNYSCASPLAGGRCAPDPTGEFSFSTRNFALGLHAAVGLSFPVGGARMFTELRYYGLTLSQQESWLLPLVVGVRF